MWIALHIIYVSKIYGQNIWADALAVKFRHADAEAEEHAFDLVVLSFVDGEAAGG